MKNKKMLKEKIDKLIEIAKSVYPTIRYNVIIPGIEGEDAEIEFFSPRKYEDKLDNVLRPIAADMLLDDGYFISILTLLDRNLSDATHQL